MGKYQRILVPVDGSDTSNRAVEAAAEFARESDGTVRVVHAIEELPHVAAFESSSPLFEAMQGAAERVLAESALLAKKGGARAETLLIDKPARHLGQVIAQAAGKWEADLVVVGTHGRRGFERMLLGSGAEQIIRHSPVPVLVIRGSEGG